MLLYKILHSSTITLMNPQDPSRATDQQQPSEPTQSVPAPPEVVQSQEPEQPFYHPEDEQQGGYVPSVPEVPAPAPHPHHIGSVSWTASEFIAHDKDPKWFAALAGVTVLVVAIVYLMTRAVFSAVVVAITGVLFGVVANRSPREMHYSVDDHGVSIGNKIYPYGDFRSFSVQQEGPLKSLTFMPLKRFMPPLSMYYDPADEDKISDVLTARLPMQDHPHDPLEKLMKWIRF